MSIILRETNIIEVINATNIARNETVAMHSRVALLGNVLVDVPSGRNTTLDNKPKDKNAAKAAIIDNTVINNEGGLFNAAEASLLDAKIQITFGKTSRVFEPPRVCRRLFDISYAATGRLSRLA